MKVLLDTNIIIHRETVDPKIEDIGKLFWWLDKLGYTKCIHNVISKEIDKNQNVKARKALHIKIESYFYLATQAPIKPEVKKISEQYDTTENDKNDTLLLNELFSKRVDLLITEDRKLHKKAVALGIDDKVFTIESFLEKVTAENPDLLDYKIPTVKKEHFGNLDLADNFFNSLIDDYVGFEDWFNKKANEIAYVCLKGTNLCALLYLKREDESEDYSEISPTFLKKKRLKIGTFKVQLNGFKIGERFLKIVFDNALHLAVDEVYVTIFDKKIETIRLVKLLEDFGFHYHGIKKSQSGEEKVFVRNLSKQANLESPKLTYPFMSRKARKFIVPIWPQYHTDLFPDSILSNESPMDFVENEPFRNAISKVYASRSIYKKLNSGDIIIFYRTGGLFKSVVTTLGIVENIHTKITNVDHFVKLCRKRSVFSDEELRKFWKYKPNFLPFVVNFLYTYSFPKRINLKRLIELGIIPDVDSAPRGFEEISDMDFKRIIQETQSNEAIIVD